MKNEVVTRLSYSRVHSEHHDLNLNKFRRIQADFNIDEGDDVNIQMHDRHQIILICLTCITRVLLVEKHITANNRNIE